MNKAPLHIALGTTGVLALLYVAFTAFLHKMLNDPSSAAPPYVTPAIAHARQTPLPSPFGHDSTAMDVVQGVDLRGKIAVMTGAHSGTGRETAKALAHAGATIIALARDVDRAKESSRDIPSAKVEYVDLLQPDSINAFTTRYVESGRPIHILVNSAAIMGTPLERDARGYERQFATNVLGHLQLTKALLPALERAHGARVINVASRGHHAGGIQFDDIHFHRMPYTGMRAYAQSKTALILLSLQEDKLWRNKNIRVFSTTPGPVPSSDLFAAGMVGQRSAYQVAMVRHLAAFVRFTQATAVLNLLRRPANVGDRYKTVQQGGATAAWAATSAMLGGLGGVYIEDSNVAPLVPEEGRAPHGVKSWAVDETVAERLWTVCEQMPRT